MAKKSRHPLRERKMSDKTTRLSNALLYASSGAPVVPLHGLKNGRCTCGDGNCERPGRHPRTELDIADATLDRKEIRRMWRKWPNAKIGIVMGWPGKLMALMTDGPEGSQTLPAIAVTQGKVPRTVTIRDHDRRLRLFRFDGKVPRNREIANGVRILGDAALIVAPSNLTGSTSKRRFATGHALAEVEIATAPQWLLEISKRAEPACGSQPRLVQSKLAGFPSNDRNGESRLVVTRRSIP
jgi:putative DNA primase/helicase